VLTIADIPLACEAHRWRGLPLAHRARPRLDAWYARLQALPAARGVLDLPLT
jgi:glutathione S-transferase